jgi:hypothetical protein
MRRWIRRVALIGLAVLGAIQLVPYGWWHENPPVLQDAPWPDAETEALARDACYSCHSNETNWPVYSYIAPMSWTVRSDVERGRDEFNFSDWAEYGGDADKAAEAIAEGSMPPSRYTLLHPDAKLSDEEAAQLVAVLESLDDGDGGGNSGPGGGD